MSALKLKKNDDIFESLGSPIKAEKIKELMGSLGEKMIKTLLGQAISGKHTFSKTEIFSEWIEQEAIPLGFDLNNKNHCIILGMAFQVFLLLESDVARDLARQAKNHASKNHGTDKKPSEPVENSEVYVPDVLEG